MRVPTIAVAVALALVAPPARAACDGPLTFDPLAPLWRIDPTARTCPRAFEWIPCHCGEFMTWPATPRTEWYVVRRMDFVTSRFVNVGIAPANAAPHWYFKDDASAPQAGRFYKYTVRACRRDPFGSSTPQCSPNWSNGVRYRGVTYVDAVDAPTP